MTVYMDACELCGEGTNPDKLDEGERTELEAHVINEHKNSTEQIQQTYPDIFEKYSLSLSPNNEMSAGTESSDTEDGAGGGGTVTKGKPTGADPVVPETESTGQTQSREQTEQSSEMSVSKNESNQGKGKWYMLGIGGGGSNIIDAVLLRKKTLEAAGHPLAAAWQSGVGEVAALNTNVLAELSGTYFAQEYTSGSLSQTKNRYEIGPRSEQGAGVSEKKGAALAGYDIDKSEQLAQQKGEKFSKDYMQDVQGVIIFHTAIKGTGSGSAPLIAEWIEDNVFDKKDYFTEYGMTFGQSLFSGLILPGQSAGEDGSVEDFAKRNGLVGMARMSKVVDAIIPFDNGRLRQVSSNIGVTIKGTTGYNLEEYQKQNESLIAWLEGATLSSIAESGSTEDPIRGDSFDVKDMYTIPQEMMGSEDSARDASAVIIAPAYGQVSLSKREEFDRGALHDLLLNTVQTGKLVPFDHQTAWGGSFIFLRPEGQKEQIQRTVEAEARELLLSDDLMGVDNESAGQVSTRIYQVTLPELQEPRLWAGFWNPEIPRIREWYNWGEDVRDRKPGLYDRLNQVWEDVESLFSYMGRDSLSFTDDD